IIFGMSLWLALRLWHKDKKQGDKLPAHQFYFAFVLLGLIFLQCLAGALVAGLEAGRTYTDWPFMDGQFIPSGLFAMSPLIVNFFENILTVQWQHRIIAYLLFGLAIWHYWQQTRSTSARSAPAESNVASNSAAWLALAICGQAILGIATVMGAVPLILAVLHQFGALLVLTIAIYHLYRLRIACNIE
ncbi:MAG: COX15/CtaA family protein, partial [Alphaproteobacteria bacterium]|nr:COX15/CtaA family protein [Alphaproteobacteria bacterium]